MSYTTLDSVFDAFKELKVLIIGDVMLDTYIYGTVNRISPEAPVPVVSVNRRENRLGGAANVALNVQALGATPVLCSIIGDDLDADEFKHLLTLRGITDKGVIKSNKRVTTVKNRIISGSQQMMRIDSESIVQLDPIEEKALLDHIKHLMDEVDLVIFEDYDKGCLNKNIITEAIQYANSKNIPTAVDPKKQNFLSYIGCTLFKPNLKELKEGLKVEFEAEDQDQLEEAVLELQNRLNFSKAIITLSEKGIFLFEKEGSNALLPAHVRRISDVSGAGDTVVSIAGLCMTLGLPNAFTAALSNLGGGIVCEYLGVVPIELERLIEEAQKNDVAQYLN